MGWQASHQRPTSEPVRHYDYPKAYQPVGKHDIVHEFTAVDEMNWVMVIPQSPF